MMSGPSSPDLGALDYQVWTLRAMLESYHRLQSKPKAVPQFKDAIQLIWSASLEEASDNAAKDYRKQRKACVSANGGRFEYIM